MDNDRIWTLVSRKLNGEATASELFELEELAKKEGNADLYLRAINEYWKMPVAKEQEFLEATYFLHLDRLKQQGFELETDKQHHEPPALYLSDPEASSFFARSRVAVIALSILVALVAVIFFLVPEKKASTVLAGTMPAQSEVSTKNGSRTNIQLPDGSSVSLNSNSKLVYDNRSFGNVNREVTLTGEAYFDIAKNADKPFIIHVNNIQVKVLGTVFNIKAYPGEENTITSLIRGSVEVILDEHNQKIVMKPNDKLIVSNGKSATLPSKDEQKTSAVSPGKYRISMDQLTIAADQSTIMETAWVENKLMFDNERFDEVAVKMERWYGVTIQFSDDAPKMQPLTGTFEKETVGEALKALQLATPFFQYKIRNSTITITKTND